jgi:hypothetical protein
MSVEVSPRSYLEDLNNIFNHAIEESVSTHSQPPFSFPSSKLLDIHPDPRTKWVFG